MNPFQKNKVDMSALSEEEQKAFRLYGKLPNRKDVLQNKLKERKYFDSGDYALSKAGKTSEISPTDVGREHPVPENIPHLSTSPSAGSGPHERGSISGPIGGIGLNTAVTGGPTLAPPGVHGAVQSGSPVKEGSWLQREQSVDDQDNGGLGEKEGDGKGVPIRGAGEKS